jgi:hypothetical protein
VFGFETAFEFRERHSVALEFPNPTLRDLVNRHWIEVVQFFATAPHDGDEVRGFQDGEVLRHCLPITSKRTANVRKIPFLEFSPYIGRPHETEKIVRQARYSEEQFPTDSADAPQTRRKKKSV